MKIAALSDIHGNLEALEAVCADIDALNPDKVYCIGDIVGYGCSPAECVKIIRDRGYPTVMGNWEQVIMVKPQVDISKFNSMARNSAYWAMGALSVEDRTWMGELPVSIVENGVQIVHGSTHGDRVCKYLMKTEDAEEAFAAAEAPVVLHGHTHVPLAFFGGDEITYVNESPFEIPEGTPALINVGATGQPRDKDPRACYGVYDADARTFEWRRCEYDVDKTVEKMKLSGLPDKLAERLKLGA